MCWGGGGGMGGGSDAVLGGGALGGWEGEGGWVSGLMSSLL